MNIFKLRLSQKYHALGAYKILRSIQLRRFHKHERGATVIEFALLAPIFFTLMFAIMEVSFVFFADMLLMNAMMDSARLIRTGQNTSAVSSISQFTTEICNRSLILSGCQTRLKVQVTPMTNYNLYSGAGTAITNYAQFSALTPTFNVGGSEQIVLVRAYYDFNLFTGYISSLFSTPGAGNKRIIGGAMVFRNEPF